MISPKGVKPTNSLKAADKGFSFLVSFSPSLKPLGGSLICQVIIANKIPGNPTAMKATCHPFNPKGASDIIGKASFQLSTINPPIKIPIPEPI